MYEQYTPDRRDLLAQRNKQYIKDFLRKPFTLVIAVAILSVSILDSICSILSSVGMIPIIEQLNELLRSTEFGENSSISISTKAGMPVNTVLLLLGLCIMYFKSRKKDDSSAPVAGATVFYVWAIVSLVGDLLAALMITLLPILIFIGISYINAHTGEPAVDAVFSLLPFGSDSTWIVLTGLTLSAMLIIMAVIYVISGISRLKFASSLRKGVTEGILSSKGIVPFAIVNIIFAVMALHSALCMLPTVFYSDRSIVTGYSQLDEILSAVPIPLIMATAIISLALSAIVPLFLARFALRYRKHILNAGEDGCNLPEPELVSVQACAPCESDSHINTQTDPNAVWDSDANPYAPIASATEEDVDAPPVTVSSFCFMCGNPVTPEQKFCANCGNKLSSD